MFDQSSKTIEVSVRMLDGATLRGGLMQTQTASSLEGVLSKDTPFLEFISKDGQRKFILKNQIAPVLVNPKDSRYIDAFTMLGVRKECTFDEAKVAYHRLAKQYHPDNYSGIDLPEEVQRYVTDMFRQINTAFTEVRSEIQTAA